MANEFNRGLDTQERGELTTAELARSPKIARDVDESIDGRSAMFPNNETESFRGRWHDVQADFVDSPRESVKKADELVAAIIQRLAEVFTAEREKLESNWGEGRDVSTEDLRQALRRYRSFFDRLLAV